VKHLVIASGVELKAFLLSDVFHTQLVQISPSKPVYSWLLNLLVVYLHCSLWKSFDFSFISVFSQSCYQNPSGAALRKVFAKWVCYSCQDRDNT